MRYGRNNNSQPYGAAPNSTFDNWGDSTNKFNSINVNHNWVLGGSKLNEFIFQYADFSNQIAVAAARRRTRSFPNGVTTGANGNTPQTTQQKKYQFRDDFSWHMTGMGGLGHDFKAGVNFINEPRLFITFNTGKGAIFNTHLTNDVERPDLDRDAERRRRVGEHPDQAVRARTFQDDWRVSDRLTLNLGLRYDLMTGYQFDQSKNPNFVADSGGRRGRPAQRHQRPRELRPGPAGRHEQHPAAHRRACSTCAATARTSSARGWGIYTDFGYTNSNVLFAAADATGKGFGTRLQRQRHRRHPQSRRQLLSRSASRSTNIASQNQVAAGAFPLFGQWVDPRLEQPYTHAEQRRLVARAERRTRWSASTTCNSHGRDLNFRPRVNQRIPGTTIRARLGAVVPTPLSPNTNAQPAGGQPRQERVQRADPAASAGACRTAWTSPRPTRCRRATARSATRPTS